MKKYKILTDQSKKLHTGTTVYRIQALIDFSNVKQGDIGGWVQDYKNLHQLGGSWIYDDACVLDNARISGYAWVLGNSIISDNAIVTDRAIVKKHAIVKDFSQILDNSIVTDRATILGHSKTMGYSEARDNCVLRDFAVINNNDVVFQDMIIRY